MRTSYLIFIFTLYSYVLNAQTTYPSGVTGCIARWTFDSADQPFLSSLPDMSGNNNNGTAYGIATTSGFRNKPLKAGAFDGMASWAEVMHNTIISPNEMTIISLVKLNSFNSALCESSMIISKGYPGFIAGNYGQALSDNPYDGGCGIYSPNYTQLVTQIGPPILTVPSGNYISLNKWYFFASTISSSTVNHYQIEMDTNFKASSLFPINTINGTYSIGTNTQNVSIGRHLNPSYPYWLNGSMDELILFNRALTNAEVYSVYSYLWGWATKSDDFSKAEDEVLVNCDNKSLHIFSTSQKIKQIRIFDISGRILRECSNSFNKIDLGNIQSEILLVKIELENRVVISKKILNR